MNEIVFAEQNQALIQSLAEVSRRKKLLEKQEKEIKEELLPLMEKHGVVSIDNDYIKISYVPAGDPSTDIDKSKLKAEMPELYNDILSKYPRATAGKKAHLRFNPK